MYPKEEKKKDARGRHGMDEYPKNKREKRGELTIGLHEHAHAPRHSGRNKTKQNRPE